MIGRVLPLTITAVRYAATRDVRVFLNSPVNPWLTPQPVNLKYTVPCSTVDNLSGRRLEKTLVSDYDHDHDHDHDMEISVATLDDLEQVMHLCGNIYNGLDYLPATFSHIVDGPGMQGFLFKIHGELVGFGSTVMLDREESLLMQSARVKESLQGRGLMGIIFRLFERRVLDRALYPHLRRLKSNSTHSLASKGYYAVEKKKISGRAFLASSLSRFTLKNSPGRVSALRYDEARELFQSDRTRWAHLFPQDKVIVAMKPFSVMPDNIPVIMSSGVNTQFCATKALDGTYSWLSAGSYYFCPAGIRYMVDIYGTGEGEKGGSRSGAARTGLGASDSSTAKDFIVDLASDATEDGKKIMYEKRETKGSAEELGRMSDLPETARGNGKLSGKSKQDDVIEFPDQMAGVQRRTEAQPLRDHLIAHLRRLKGMRSSLPGTVIFDVSASDRVQEVVEDVTRELEEIPFVWPYDGLVVWEKNIGDKGL